MCLCELLPSFQKHNHFALLCVVLARYVKEAHTWSLKSLKHVSLCVISTNKKFNTHTLTWLCYNEDLQVRIIYFSYSSALVCYHIKIILSLQTCNRENCRETASCARISCFISLVLREPRRNKMSLAQEKQWHYEPCPRFLMWYIFKKWGHTQDKYSHNLSVCIYLMGMVTF